MQLTHVQSGRQVYLAAPAGAGPEVPAGPTDPLWAFLWRCLGADVVAERLDEQAR